jgi:hypothetical protein
VVFRGVADVQPARAVYVGTLGVSRPSQLMPGWPGPPVKQKSSTMLLLSEAASGHDEVPAGLVQRILHVPELIARNRVRPGLMEGPHKS